MTVYVFRNGQLVERWSITSATGQHGDVFPTPYVSRFQPFESPITGQTISSWRQRDADMQAGGAVDPRDLPKKPFEERKNRNAKVLTDADDTFRWDDA